MDLFVVIIVIFVVGWIGGIGLYVYTRNSTPEKRAQYKLDMAKAHEEFRTETTLEQSRDAQIFCPHCQTFGTVETRQVKQKKGISGTKATAAVFTAGTSMLATGLSRKEKATRCECSNCGMVWLV
jgi:hypothetical protein